ncbi:phosphoinositide 3-kinase adapter protein 1 [Rhinophrynus dorsalis]
MGYLPKTPSLFGHAEHSDAGDPKVKRTRDLLVLHGPDATEWCSYIQNLFQMHQQVQELEICSYEVSEEDPIAEDDLQMFQSCKCILTLFSRDLVECFYNPDILDVFQRVLTPPKKVVILFCGVTDSEDFTEFFTDFSQWKQLSSEDDPELYITAVTETVSEDSGCDTDTGNKDNKSLRSTHLQGSQQTLSQEKHGNLLSIQPERIRCGVKTQLYIIFKCKLDCKIKNEVYFNPLNGPSVRLPATVENEYLLSVDAPDLPSGLVFLKVFSGDLILCEAKITYFTDMEEISYLLENATNPVEFMCQAFKIVPYNIDILDKLLTESLKNNIPASGLHLFGINQIEEENISANQRDEELPTLLHFSAKYGLKNLTALLLTCPGALQAYSVSNKHGDFPNNMAEKYGFKDLRQFIDEYVETADMLKTHIKEELMQGEDEDNPMYESMANLSTDLLIKCSLNPGCDDDIYESMVGLALPCEADDIYVEMMQIQGVNQHGLTGKDSVIRKILEGGSLEFSCNEEEEDPYNLCEHEDVYDIVQEGTLHSEVGSRPPVPIPRPLEPEVTEPYISKLITEKTKTRKENVYIESAYQLRRSASVKMRTDRSQSSIYDPFGGMKTPGQRELITLQERVKLGMISVDEALLEFKDWQLNQKRRSDSFRYQQENLKRLRDSINRRRNENKKKGKNTDLNITKPIRRGQNPETKPECSVYETRPVLRDPPKREIKRGNWKTDSTSSTTSSTSDRSSIRSILSLSSGMEGDNEDNEIPENPPRHSPKHSPREEPPPPPRPPRIPNRATRSMTDLYDSQGGAMQIVQMVDTAVCDAFCILH